jgi:putative transposase
MDERHGRREVRLAGRLCAFTVGISQQAHTIAYINSQAEHHRNRSFEEEFLDFLQKHGIEYDPQYVWG